MIQSKVYGKTSPSWIGFICWKKNIGILKMNMVYIICILIESNVKTIESSKLKNYLTTKH